MTRIVTPPVDGTRSEWTAFPFALMLLLCGTAVPQESAESSRPAEAAFSSEITALPFPPDARDVSLDVAFKDIEYTSRSPLTALANFYREQMTARGWREDREAASIEDDAIELTFQHEGAEVTVELENGSEGVDVSLDCEGLNWGSANDPAALVAAGVPQPRAHVFLQQELPRPKDAQEVVYRDGKCEFKSLLTFEKACDFYLSEMPRKGWREVASDRFFGKYVRSTVYRKAPVTVKVSANKNHQAEGSRISAEYASTEPERQAAPLAAVERVEGQSPRPRTVPASPPGREAERAHVLDVSKNKGMATVTAGAVKSALTHVAAYREKDSPESTHILFSNKPIPFAKLQQMLAKEDSISFIDLYGFESPVILVLQVSENYVSLSYSAPGVGIGQGIDEENLIRDIKTTDIGLSGTIGMKEPAEVFDEPFHVTTRFDAAVMRPDTTIGRATGTPAAPLESVADSAEMPVPKDAIGIQKQRTRYREVINTSVTSPLADVVAFYRTALPSADWKEDVKASKVDATSASLSFNKPGHTAEVSLGRMGDDSTIQVVVRNEAAAVRDGLHPEAGKAKLVLGNAHTQDVVIKIGTYGYNLRAGQGGDDPKTGKNFSVAPGKYTFTIQVPGRAPATDTIEITAGSAWGILALPTGGYFADQLY